MTKTPRNLPLSHGRISSSHGRVKGGRHFADFVPRGIPWLWTHAVVNLRHFVKDYSLAVVLTLAFIFLISVASLVRVSQKSSLAELLANATTVSQDYDSLISIDTSEPVQRGDISGDPGANRTPVGTRTSTTLNSGGTGGISSPNQQNNNGSNAAPSQPFAASIGAFRQDDVLLECSTQNPNKAHCAKRYVFGASVSTQNGPGTLSYGWRSNFAGANEDGSYTAEAGSSSRTLQKSISIPCLDTGNYSMQFVIISPTQVQSAVLTINHNCVGI